MFDVWELPRFEHSILIDTGRVRVQNILVCLQNVRHIIGRFIQKLYNCTLMADDLKIMTTIICIDYLGKRRKMSFA